MMAECKYVVCTAGFESVSEAAYLGKPLFMVPVENHVEQQINALDAVRRGPGVTDKNFDLNRLKELPDRLNNGEFREWLKEADAILLRAIYYAVGRPELMLASRTRDGAKSGKQTATPVAA
jgi:UDP-N-acetylglucosamine:LPS N-acetylglucosamine transferase